MEGSSSDYSVPNNQSESLAQGNGKHPAINEGVEQAEESAIGGGAEFDGEIVFANTTSCVDGDTAPFARSDQPAYMQGQKPTEGKWAVGGPDFMDTPLTVPE